MYLKQLIFSEIRRNNKKRQLKYKILIRYMAVSIAFLLPLHSFVQFNPTHSCQAPAYSLEYK